MIDYSVMPIAAIINGNAEIISARNVWRMATTKAAARKATAAGVNQICAHMERGKMQIFQICGYTRERGLYMDLLNEEGRTIK